MDSIAELKELSPTPTPLILFDIEFEDGSIERWGTHRITLGGDDYEPRVLRHTRFDTNLASEYGGDSVPTLRLIVSNVDGYVAQIDRAAGLRGATLTARFTFFDFDAIAPSTDNIVLFRGVLDAPGDLREDAVRLSATNRLNLARVSLPPVRIQRRCPWDFPATATERMEAVDGGVESRQSPFYSCGYSADQPGGRGNLNGSQPFVSCAKTKSDCVQRGMFDGDTSSNINRRFGGAQYLPASIVVRAHQAKRTSVSEPAFNEARYDDVLPIAYGTTWLTPPVVFARNDGNLTRLEVILAQGKLSAIHKVVVNGTEIPLGVSGRDMTATGWWNLFAAGDRTGGFNLNFTDGAGMPLGDPYGSIAALSIVVPNHIHSPGSLPRVTVLVAGIETETFDSAGDTTGWIGQNNPAWILLDLLRQSGWNLGEFDLSSFAAAAAKCDEQIPSFDNAGNPISAPRFQCNLAIRRRRTAADLIRGVQNNARLQLAYDDLGRLSARVADTIASQHPVAPRGSNVVSPLNGGWPAYHYSDGSDATAANILRLSNGGSSIRISSRSNNEVPNRVSAEFADEHNEFQQDSLVVTDTKDILRAGREIDLPLVVDGLPSYDQAIRILRHHLDRSIEGNQYVEFETTVHALHQRPGDIITLTSLRDGFLSQPLRILRITPATDFVTAQITAQVHNDSWFQDGTGALLLSDGRSRQSTVPETTPASLVGDGQDSEGFEVYGVAESNTASGAGAVLTELSVSFSPPTAGTSSVAGVPIVGLTPTIVTGTGQLAANQTLYYAISAMDSAGLESYASFVVRADIGSASSNSVRLNQLRFSSGTASFNVYRGETPGRLRRIAAQVTISSEYLDAGGTNELIGAPNPNYDHANFYWRLENQDEEFATTFSPTQIGSDQLSLPADAMVGHIARITRGKGRLQERVVVANDATTLTVEPPWEIQPDLSSAFVISDNTWQFGGSAPASPARFVVPSLTGRVVQITGRAADARNVESLPGEAIVVRYRLGGGDLGITDSDVPPQPFFAVTALRDGNIELSGIGFLEFQNTQTVSTGTFVLTQVDELAGPFQSALDASSDAVQTTITTSPALGIAADDYIQIGQEVLQIAAIDAAGTTLTVERGACGTLAAAHAQGVTVFPLKQRVVVVPFERALFGTQAGSAWSAREWMPNARIACAELWLTNLFGTGPLSQLAFTQLAGGGLRTFRGGQYTFQVAGVVAVLSDAVPGVQVQDATSIRDIVAFVREAPTGGDIVVRVHAGAVALADLTIPSGETTSQPVDGIALPPLVADSLLTLDLVSVGLEYPGADLSVAVRL